MNMIEKQSIFKRFISILVCAALMISYLPMASLRTFAADAVTDSADIVADAGTAHTWETMMGTSADGNRYAGRVWADKSVYTDGQLALLNSSGAAGSTFRVDLEEDEAFQIIFSALGSSMTTTSTNSYVGPMDVVLVLDTSISMATTKNGRTRTVDIGSDTIALLCAQRQEQATRAISKFVFTQENSPEPMHPQSPTRYFKMFEKRYGIKDFHPHKLRHSSASVAITNGADVVSVSQRLGHSDTAVTLRMYAHANAESIRRAGDIARKAVKRSIVNE
jgi:hypothetical protein